MASLYKQLAPSVRDHDAAERVKWIYRQAKRFEDYWRPDIDRYASNARFAWGLDYGQWPSYVVEVLKSKGKSPPTFNVTLDKIEGMVGSLLSNPYDMRYTPMTSKLDSMVLKLQDMWFAEKAALDWDLSEIDALFNSFAASVGYERMYVSDALDSSGNIAWESLDPTHVWLDPGWKTQYRRDLKRYFTWGMYLPSEIMAMNPNKTDRIKELKIREEIEGICYSYFEGVVPYASPDEKWGSYHRVYEYHWIEEEDVWWEYDLKNRCDFPETGYKPGSEDDKRHKAKYFMMQQLRPEDVRWVRKKRRCKYIEKICPSIDLELIIDGGKDKIQTSNVNLYPFGRRYNGRYIGHVDRLRDLNVAINKGELDIESIQAHSAKGAFILDRALAGGDRAKEEEIEAHWNDDGARIWADEGSTSELGPHGGIIPLPIAQVSPDLFRQQDRRYDIHDRLSKVSAAQDGRQESSKESGRLFKYKFDAGMLSQKLAAKDYEGLKRDKAEAYPRQAKITHAGETKTFAGVGDKDAFDINVRGRPIQLPNGESATPVYDDISLLPEIKVILTPSKAGINVRSEMQDLFGGLLQSLNDPLDRPLRICLEEELVSSSSMSDDKKAEFAGLFRILKREALLQKGVSIKNLENQLSGLMGGQGGPPQIEPPAGGGMNREPSQVPQQVNWTGPSDAQQSNGTPQQAEQSILQEEVA